MRRREAKTLLANKNYAGSYYLMGYAVECAIKAAIAKLTQRHEFPDQKRANESYKHELKTLLQTAALWSALESAMKTNPALNDNWAVVKDWNTNSRYVVSTSQAQARDLYSACTARTNGILSWLKKYW
jgi:AbiV family abortive infection protein